MAIRCKVCLHPGRTEIEAMTLNAAPYGSIATLMRKKYPAEPKLLAANISRHKSAHLLTQPIAIIDPETGERGNSYLTPVEVNKQLLVDRKALPAPEDGVSAEDALRVIINAGISNILADPSIVTPKFLIAALVEARARRLGGDDDTFKDAWAALAGERAKERPKTTRRRRVTVEEETISDGTSSADTGPVVAGAVVPPDEWSEVELTPLLGEGK